MSLKTLKDNGYEYLINDEAPSAKAPFGRYFDLSDPLLADAVAKGGRGEALIYNAGDMDVVMRHDRRGGLLGRIVKDHFLLCEPHAHRAFDEMRLLYLMEKKGLPVPRPILARERITRCCIVQDIVIGALNARDLSYVMRERSLTRIEMLRLGGMIKAFFEQGVDHTDLNIRNILLDDQGKFYLIDFDKCFLNHPTAKRRAEIIERLQRSFRKEYARFPEVFHYNDEDFALIKGSALS